MRLIKVKLAGFKSFVDSTTISFPGRVVGVVGPNGCGKSNVIDAVRWVMGESSAKHLRGDSMSDVIFNGSNARKPVGQAAIELVFDNSDGSAGGQYASYNEMSIKRQVTRDGQSHYFLNGTRCRRRDIADIFLGTGLGPRSYAIIEQGMISRLIEAKPEELRVFLEEAAGISKYKERRRETENRIRHTQENLERLNDLREEVAKHLNHLQRQARSAERYKELKARERQVRGELLALKWRAVRDDAAGHERAIRERETAYEALVAEQRAAENALEGARVRHGEATDAFNEVQGRYYEVGAEIARLEQSIQHHKDMRAQQQAELEKADQSRAELEEQVQLDRCELEELERALAHDEPGLETARERARESGERRARAEETMAAWQAEWEAFNQRATEPAQAAEVERTRLDHLERQLVQLRERVDKIEAERQELDPAQAEREIASLQEREQALARRGAEQQERLEQLHAQIDEAREASNRINAELDEARTGIQHMRGRLASLEALQQAALHQHEEGAGAWLASHGLSDAPRLVQRLSVQPGWEPAVEAALGAYLEAVCVERIDPVAAGLERLEHGRAVLLEAHAEPGASPAQGDLTPLVEKVGGDVDVAGLLAGVYTAQDLGEALRIRARLRPGESVVTADGVWLGPRWLRVVREADDEPGMLAREKEINELGADLESGGERVEELEERLEAGGARLRELEGGREEAQAAVNQAHRDHAAVQARLDSRRERLAQMQARVEALQGEAEGLRAQRDRDEEALRAARGRLEEAVEKMEALEVERRELTERGDRVRGELEEARERARTDRDAAHELALKVESTRTRRDSMRQSLDRMQTQLEHLKHRRGELETGLAQSEAPLEPMETELQQCLGKRGEVEQELAEARRHTEGIAEEMRELDERRAETERQAEARRGELEQARLAFQELKVRRQTLEEQLAETGLDRQALLEGLSEENATAETWQAQLSELERRIDRLGPINLAAIDEYKEQSERKQYLDAQHQDLTEALETLESAIHKIDRQTRQRFRETFEQVNVKLQELFPRLFGGGNAHLEMTGDDLLSTGVAVMARPPGKRISTIHLLSGGEKALTAVALVFAMFELNPAPFCMLDEVDAPLDDANVGRFCELVRDMSERVQFVIITHNKTTMELTHQLTGVTMNEPGVSRLVAVDVDEAYRMAVSQ